MSQLTSELPWMNATALPEVAYEPEHCAGTFVVLPVTERNEDDFGPCRRRDTGTQG